MNKVGAMITLISILIALCLAAYFTISFLRGVADARESLPRKIYKWLKNVLDALWGAG